MSSLLAGKVAIVTGASSGIGRAIAATFAAEGAEVMVADIVTEPLEGGESVLELISRSGGTASFQKADVGNWDDVDSLISSTVERYGRLDVMVNNAAVFSGTPLLETSVAEWERVMAVNLTGMFYGCKRAVQQMLTQEPRSEVRGRLINLGSQQGIVTAPDDTPYGVSKAGAIYLTKANRSGLCQRLDRLQLHLAGQDRHRSAGVADRPSPVGKRAPTYSLAASWPPQDIANAAVFLASDRATYITGSNLIVGWRMAGPLGPRSPIGYGIKLAEIRRFVDLIHGSHVQGLFIGTEREVRHL